MRRPAILWCAVALALIPPAIVPAHAQVRLTIDGDLATDHLTGLYWHVDHQRRLDWTDATTYCETLGARLPTRAELEELASYTALALVEQVTGLEVDPYFYWASTPSNLDRINVDLFSGESDGDSPDTVRNVRCVCD